MADLVLKTAARPEVTSGAVRDLSAARAEVPAVSAWRARAREIYLNSDLPDRVRHLWRYSDPQSFLPELPLSGLEPPAPAVDLPRGGPVVYLGGPEPTLNDAAAAGVSVRALGHDPADLEQLGRLAGPELGLFEALNGAAWNAGVSIRIRKDLKAPLRVVIPATAAASLPRLLIQVDRQVEATVIQDHLDGQDTVRVVGVSELFLAPGARLTHVLLQRWQPAVRGHLTVRSHLDRDCRITTAVASLGGAMAKLDLGTHLAGPGARSEMVGMALQDGRQHFDHHTEHRHLSPHTWSNLNFKVALAGRSRSIYTGLIRIEEGAPESEAYQENRNLLLSRNCRAETIPELEILTDEVRCTHGATVAPVDPEQIFYLRCRGLNEQEALNQIVGGFFAETVAWIPESLRPEIAAQVARRLALLRRGN